MPVFISKSATSWLIVSSIGLGDSSVSSVCERAVEGTARLSAATTMAEMTDFMLWTIVSPMRPVNSATLL
jgi:hypothetical protein